MVTDILIHILSYNQAKANMDLTDVAIFFFHAVKLSLFVHDMMKTLYLITHEELSFNAQHVCFRPK